MGLFSRIFGSVQLTPIARRSLNREQLTELTVPVALAMLEGGFIGVIADKIYNAPPFVIALLTAAPMFGNLSSYLWNGIASARSKVPLVVLLQALTMVCLLLVAFSPATPVGIVLLCTGVVLARIFTAGTITIRSVVWSLNYGREIRARTTGRLQLITSLVMVVTTAVGAPILDGNPTSFRFMYIIATIIALLGIASFSRIEVSGEMRHRVAERQARRIVSTQSRVPLASFWRILRTDKQFARYEFYQFLGGVSGMMLEAPLIYLVSREMNASYTVSIALSVIIPHAIGTVTLPMWARYLDKVHVAEFRARMSVFWVVSQCIMWIGAMLHGLWLLALGRVTMGFARSAGTLAWQLGHNDFADERELVTYMGIHVTLTGLRGAFAPFLGIALYVGWSASWLPDFDGIGAHVFLVATFVSIWSWVGFRALQRDINAMKSMHLTNSSNESEAR